MECLLLPYGIKKQTLFSARDRYGIKPFYYSIIDNNFIFSLKPKALIPFQKNINVSQDKLFEYLTFQYNTGTIKLFLLILINYLLEKF